MSHETLYFSGYSSSVILSGKPNYAYQLNSWLPAKFPRALCYRASRDGWNSRTFHSKCDNKGATVTIIRVGTYIFGGYADYSWSGRLMYEE